MPMHVLNLAAKFASLQALVCALPLAWLSMLQALQLGCCEHVWSRFREAPSVWHAAAGHHHLCSTILATCPSLDLQWLSAYLGCGRSTFVVYGGGWEECCVACQPRQNVQDRFAAPRRSVLAWRKWFHRQGSGGFWAASPSPAPDLAREQLLDRFHQHTQHCPACSKVRMHMQAQLKSGSLCLITKPGRVISAGEQAALGCCFPARCACCHIAVLHIFGRAMK